ncbi:MAG: hypothetical protein ACYCZU_07675, partial [Devosia sp.]
DGITTRTEKMRRQTTLSYQALRSQRTERFEINHSLTRSDCPAALAQGNSEPGIDRYLENKGRQQATEVGAQCGSGAGSGSFGYFGKDGNNLSGGADGQQTGVNNSAVCGNNQSN